MSTTWTIDPSHSSAAFTVRHLMITNVRGEFQKLSGTVQFDPAAPEATKIEVVIDAASINSREAQRDAHLKSPDFLDVARFPAISFVSTAVAAKAGGFEIQGNLTMHGTTRAVTLEAEALTAEQKDPWGNIRVGTAAKTKIKRSDFGLTWNTTLETGGVLVGDEVKIDLDVSLIKAK